MPITVTDQFNAKIDSVSPNPNPLTAALTKYVTSPAINIVLLPDLKNQLNSPLLTARPNPLSLDLNFSSTLDFGASANPEVTIAAGVIQKVNVNATAGSNLLAAGLFGSPVVVNAGEAWLSLALNGSVDAGVTGTAGDLTFGINAGAGFGMEYFRNFDPTETVADALTSVLSDFILPADVADLDAMKTGDISIVSGNGSLKVSGDFEVTTSPNPLASPNLPVVGQAISVNAGASLDVGASFQIEGAYQIRVRKLADHSVELGYFRKKGTQWTVSVQASAGVDVTAGDTDLLAKLMGALTGKPAADLILLINGGLTDDEIKKIQDEIGKSLDHSLKASLDLEFSNSDIDEAAFLYRIGTSALDNGSRAAVHAALDGDLSLLAALENNDDGHGNIEAGVTMLRSALKNVRNRKTSVNINLIGLLNFRSVFELVQKAEVVYEPLTGDLNIHETVSGTRIGVLTLPAAQEKLRKIVFDSMLTTTAYRASRSIGAMQVTSSDVHFAFNQNTNEHTMSDYLDALVGLGLLSTAGKDQILSGFNGTGPSTFLARVEFSDQACESMFLAGGQPRPQLQYEAIARQSMVTLLLPGDDDDADKYRRDIISDDDLWEQLKQLGQPSFGQALPALANDVVRLNVVRSDFTVIMWWAESMASTAQRLAQVRNFIGQADPATLEGNNTFNSLRGGLQNHMAGVVSKSGLQFGVPFGLVALYKAGAPAAMPNGIIVSDALTRVFAPAVPAGV